MAKESSGMLADIFAEDSDNDNTFLGFSDGELNDNTFKDCGSDSDCKNPELVSPKTADNVGFSLRIALRPRSLLNAGEEEERKNFFMLENTLNLEVNDTPKEAQNIPPTLCDSDSDGDLFLAKREMNIQANKAMLVQLMADLQKMPGALVKNTGPTRKKEHHSVHVPHSLVSHCNPERRFRRVTRSMGADDFSTNEICCQLELSLEEELMKVYAKPQRHDSVRTSQGKPHIVRQVEEITEDELQLIAKSMTEKIYNRVTGSTCHQCRQKTLDTKTCCRNENCRGIQGQFCGPCLHNRYGEHVKTALLDPLWQCPPCRGICNCSFCRQRDGRRPTGILFPLAQHHGFSDVHSYLCSIRNKPKTGDEDL